MQGIGNNRATLHMQKNVMTKQLQSMNQKETKRELAPYATKKVVPKYHSTMWTSKYIWMSQCEKYMPLTHKKKMHLLTHTFWMSYNIKMVLCIHFHCVTND